MVEGSGMKCIKYLMIFFNILFLIAGLLLVIIGSIAQAQQSKINYVSSAAILVIVVGGVIFLLAFLGCCGAMNENRFMLGTFGVLMIIVCVLCIAAVIVTFVFRSQVSSIWEIPLKDSVRVFNPTQKDTYLVWWPQMQLNAKCCGVNSSSDWKGNSYYKPNLPPSCCGSTNETEICVPTDPRVYKTGCADAIMSTIQRSIAIFGIIIACVAVLQILGSIFAFCLAHAIHKGYNVV